MAYIAVGGPAGARSTAVTYVNAVRRFWAFLDDRHLKIRRPEDLAPAHVNDFEIWLREGRHSDITAYRWPRLTACLRVMHEERPGAISENLFARLRHIASHYYGKSRPRDAYSKTACRVVAAGSFAAGSARHPPACRRSPERKFCAMVRPRAMPGHAPPTKWHLQRNRRSRRIQDELRLLPGQGRRSVAIERPVAAVDRELLLLACRSRMSIAVRDAVAVGDDERRARRTPRPRGRRSASAASLRAHRDLRDVDVAVGHRHQAEVLLAAAACRRPRTWRRAPRGVAFDAWPPVFE